MSPSDFSVPMTGGHVFRWPGIIWWQFWAPASTFPGFYFEGDHSDVQQFYSDECKTLLSDTGIRRERLTSKTEFTVYKVLKVYY